MTPVVTQIDPSTPITLLGCLVAAILGLAGVIGYLFRFYAKRMEKLEADRRQSDEDHAKERAKWAAEREQLRAEYEERYRVALEKHITALQKLYEDSREHESLVRREYTANMEIVAQKAAEATEKLGAVMSKFYDRYVHRK